LGSVKNPVPVPKKILLVVKDWIFAFDELKFVPIVVENPVERKPAVPSP